MYIKFKNLVLTRKRHNDFYYKCEIDNVIYFNSHATLVKRPSDEVSKM